MWFATNSDLLSFFGVPDQTTRCATFQEVDLGSWNVMLFKVFHHAAMQYVFKKFGSVLSHLLRGQTDLPPLLTTWEDRGPGLVAVVYYHAIYLFAYNCSYVVIMSVSDIDVTDSGCL